MSESNRPPVAIITGMSKGFGAAVAAELLELGWTVVGDGRDPDTLAQTVSRLQDLGTAIGIAGDVADDDHRRALLDAATSAGELRLLVNNAGGLGPSPLPSLIDADPAELLDLVRVNVVAPLALIQLCAETLTATGGAIVNVTSDAAPEDYEGWGLYGTSKVALEKVSAVLSVERPDLRVYSLDPGDMRTEMHQLAFPGEDISDRPLPETSAPAIVHFTTGTLKSGRYRASEVISS